MTSETARLIDSRIADKLGRRRNQLACALEQAIERCLDGDTVENVEVPPDTDASQVADLVRNGKPVPKWAQPLVSDLLSSQDDVWIVSPREYHFLSERYRRYVVTETDLTPEDINAIVAAEKSKRGANDAGDFLINVYSPDGNKQITVPFTSKPASTRKRPEPEPDEAKESTVHNRQMVKRSKSMEKLILDTSQTCQRVESAVMEFAGKFKDEFSGMFKDEFSGMFKDELSRVLREEIAKQWKEARPAVRPKQPRKDRLIRGASGTPGDLKNFFDELRDTGVLERKDGGRVFIQRSLAPLWKEYMGARISSYADTKDATLGNEIRKLCEEVGDVPDDHPARCLKMKKQYCLDGWELSAEE